MENMNKGLTVPKWVVVVWPKIPQMPQTFSDKIPAKAQKFRMFEKKTLSGCP